MDLTHLEEFARVAELASINKAALDLGVSQSALSRHMATLEARLGHALFSRTRRGVALTEAGVTLRAHTQSLLNQLGELRQDLGQAVSGRISLGVPPSLQQLISAPLAEAILRDAPGIRLRVTEAINNVLRERMKQSELDLCVGAFDVQVIPGYTRQALAREPLLLVGPASARLAARTPVPLLEVTKQRLILPALPNIIRRNVETALTRRGLAMPFVTDVDAIALCLELTRRGLGHTVMPACAVIGEAGHGLSSAPIRGLTLTWALYVREARRNAPAVSRAVSLLETQFRLNLARGDWLGATAARSP